MQSKGDLPGGNADDAGGGDPPNKDDCEKKQLGRIALKKRKSSPLGRESKPDSLTPVPAEAPPEGEEENG